MADRIVYGRTHSENGWPMVDTGSCVWIKVPGAPHVSLQIREGQPAKILGAFAADFNAYVEPLRDADSACWTATNSVASSNHLSGTACDLNWNGADGKTFRYGISEQRAYPPPKDRAVRDLLAFYEGMVFCGGDWSIRDFMHFQCAGNTYGSKNVAEVNDFIRRKIRPDGFSTYRRGGTVTAGGLTPQVLARIMDNRVTPSRYEQLHPAVLRALDICECHTLERRAMWFSQVGHESGGLKYQEEIASGAAYEGRTDLGNTQPGDGTRFKGRDFIQITGRHNYTKLSQWAHSKGLVPSPTFFVDQPSALATDQYAFIGVGWYWKVARDMNRYADAKDLIGATRAVNGGTNGLEDRRKFYNRALTVGADLLDPNPLDDLEALLMSDELFASRSIYRTSDQKTMSARDAIFGADACAHMTWIEQKALAGDSWAIGLVADLATGKLPASKDPWAVDRARHIISIIQNAIAAQETK